MIFLNLSLGVSPSTLPSHHMCSIFPHLVKKYLITDLHFFSSSSMVTTKLATSFGKNYNRAQLIYHKGRHQLNFIKAFLINLLLNTRYYQESLFPLLDNLYRSIAPLVVEKCFHFKVANMCKPYSTRFNINININEDIIN